jgi:hypothetical protein
VIKQIPHIPTASTTNANGILSMLALTKQHVP